LPQRHPQTIVAARSAIRENSGVTPHTRAEIQRLLKRLANGDRTAIVPSFEALWPVLRSFSARALGNDADAEDAAQQALMKLYAQVNDFDSSRDSLAWVFAIVTYECRTIRRRKQRKREVMDESLAACEATDVSPEHVLIERDLEAAVLECLAELSGDDAPTILAGIAEDRPRADATFRKRLQRALGRLRLLWRTKHEPH